MPVTGVIELAITRLICHFENEELIILVVEIGHRKDVYR